MTEETEPPRSGVNAPATHPSRWRWDWIGCAAGLALGLTDWVVVTAIGVDVTLAGRDVAPGMFALFGATYALLGWMIGRITLARARARRDARTIASQMRELERTQRALVEQEKLAAIGRLAAGIAHEVRNPLGVIRASASMVQENFTPGADSHRACTFITEEIDRLNALIESLLNFARPTELELTLVALDNLFERALALSSSMLFERGISIEKDFTNLDRDASCTTERLRLRADPDLLSQVLYGLILNSTQAVAAGGTIALRAGVCEDGVELELVDDGPGVSSEDVNRIFEPFFTTKATGTGLGLPMARRIVELHGGQLSYVEQGGIGEGGRGACFRMRLPLEAAA